MNLEINLTKEELKKINKKFKNGNVLTDGCFCGEAFAKFRDNLYVILDFSCRKSMLSNNYYYAVTNVLICEKALNNYSKEYLEKLLNEYTDHSDFIILNDFYSDSTVEDIYFIREDLFFDDESLNKVQKKLFKYYKKTYGSFSEATYENVGHFNYSKK